MRHNLLNSSVGATSVNTTPLFDIQRLGLFRLLRPGILALLLFVLVGFFTNAPLMAADPVAGATSPEVVNNLVASEPDTSGMALACWLIAFGAALAALVQAKLFFGSMIKSDPGTERMQEIAGYVQEGANAYLQQQYRVVVAFFAVVACLLAYAAFGLKVQSEFVPFAFLTGGFFSGLAGWFGMKTATAASNRTAAAAEKSLNLGLQVAFRSGAVLGLTVVGLGLLDITLWFAFLYKIWPAFGNEPLTLIEITSTMLCFGLGASAQALFARVGGGIFTKAADVGADLVGKVEQNIPEDDPRNPATIADNVGDNVGDVAGMGADLYESYSGSILATAALGAAAYSTTMLVPDGMTSGEAQLRALLLPIVISACGIFVSILGIYAVKTNDDASQKNLLKALGRGINLATLLSAVASFGLVAWLMPATEGTLVMGLPGVAFSVVTGLGAGWLIGWWTEYCTSDEYSPTQNLAQQAETGSATIIITGIADGMMSVWLPVLTIGVATLLSFGVANGFQFMDMNYFALGLYGVGIAAVGMLSTLGITLATDAYGPIADNAGGNAQMSDLPEVVRQRTDALDSLGNTTAATGKGFAIGSAALTALALLAAYVEAVRIGFERWGDSFAETLEVKDESAGYYKLSPQLIAKVSVNTLDLGKDKEAKDDPEMIIDHLYLAMPTDIRNKKVVEAWDEIKVNSKIALGESSVIKVNEDGDLALAATGATFYTNKQISLPEMTRYYDASLMNPKVLVGIFAGAMATFLFCAMTMKAVGRAAQGMVEEVRRQFKEKPGILDGSEQPDYERPIEISTLSAQKEMIMPSLLGLLLPVLIGLTLGVGGVLGLLVGTLTTGFCLAVFMSNSGGAWDNAKKYIEAGHHGGKGTLAHKAAVVGDTVGDPFKDTCGPSLNILIKLMSMVSVVVAGLVVRYSLTAMGLF